MLHYPSLLSQGAFSASVRSLKQCNCWKRRWLSGFVVLLVLPFIARATDTWDPVDFNSPAFERSVTPGRVTEGPDGKLYATFVNGGRIDGVRDGQQLGAVIRMEADGTVDTSFSIGTMLTSAWAVGFQSDGRILVGGQLSTETFNTGLGKFRLFRLNTDGSHDSSFVSPVFARMPRFITLFPDNSMLVVPSSGGDSNSGVSIMAYLEADGSMNPSFTEPDLGGGAIFAPPLFDASGRLYIAGIFETVNGTSRPGVARLLNDGSLDTTFVPTGFNPDFNPQQIRGIGLQTQGGNAGKLVVAGGTLVVPGSDDANADRPLIRLNTDGSLDSSFNLTTQTDAGMYVRPRLLEVLADDSLVIVGGRVSRFDADGTQISGGIYAQSSFSTEFFWMEAMDDGSVIVNPQPGASINGNPASTLVKFDPAGIVDTNFAPPEFGRRIYPSGFHTNSDGSSLVWGNFDTVSGNQRPGIARIWSDGNVDGSFNPDVIAPPAYVTSADVADDGRILISTYNPENRQSTIVRLWSDAIVDDTFTLDPSLGSGAGGLAPLQLSDGKVILVGLDAQRLHDDNVTLTLLDSTGTIDPSFDASGISLPGEVIRNPDDSIDTLTLGYFDVLAEDDQGRLIAAVSDGPYGQRPSALDATLIRINRDGSIDSGFNAPTLSWLTSGSSFPLIFDATISGFVQYETTTVGSPFQGAVIQEDGSILIYGLFRELSGESRAGVARLNSDGTLDTGFDVGTGATITATSDRIAQVTSVLKMPNDRIWVGGYFDTFNGQSASGLILLEASGAPVANFQTELEFMPYTGGDVVIQPQESQDQIMVGGTFRDQPGWSFPEAFHRLRQIPLVEVYDQLTGVTLIPGYDSVLSFGFSAPQADITIQWFHNDQPIDGASGTEYLVSGDPAFLGQYYAAISGGGETIHTNTVGVELATPEDTWLVDDGFTSPEFTTFRFTGRATPDGAGGYYGSFSNGSRVTGANGVTTGPVMRINGDGSLDTSFAVGDGLTNAWAVLPLADGSVLVGGEWANENTYSGRALYRVFKFSATGERDPSFHSPIFGAIPRFMTLQSDGKIIVVPSNNNGSNGGVRWIARLNGDGSMDDTFHQVWLNSPIFAPPVVDDSGNIYVGGFFTEVDGVFRPKLARLQPNGNLDLGWVPTGFNPDFPPQQIRGLALQTQGANAGKLLVAGGSLMVPDGLGGEMDSPVIRINTTDAALDTSFTYVTQADAGMAPRPRLLHLFDDDSFMVVGRTVTRFLADGAIDTGYGMPNFDQESFWLAVNPDGSVVVPTQPGASLDGSFTDGWVKLLPNGLPDSAFTAPSFELRTFPSRFIPLDDGDILTWGGFDQANSTFPSGIVRMNYDGSIDTDFSTPEINFPNVVAFADITSEGRIMAVLRDQNTLNRDVVRLESDGSLDPSFSLDSEVDRFDGLELLAAPESRTLIWAAGAQFIVNDAAGYGRLLADGSLDESFGPSGDIPPLGQVFRNQDGSINSITRGDFRILDIDDDGNFIARRTIGDHVQWAGALENALVRYNANGVPDESFNAPTVWWDTGLNFPSIVDANTNGGDPSQPPTTRAFSPFNGAVMQDDGKVIVFGGFTDIGGFYRPGIARLNSDGSVDESFNPGSGASFDGAPWRTGFVTGVTEAEDGRLWVTGFFNGFNGFIQDGLALINSDGSVVSTFDANLGFRPYIAGTMTAEVAPDGTLLVAGSYDDNGVSAFHRLFQEARFVSGRLPDSIPFAGNTSITLDGTVVGLPGATYQWFLNDAEIDGQTGATLELLGLEPGDEGSYTVRVSDSRGVIFETGSYLWAAGTNAGLGPIFGIGNLPGAAANSAVRDATEIDGVIHAVGNGVIGEGYGFGPGATAAAYWRSDEGLYAIPNLEPDSPGQTFVAANGITPDAQFIATRSRSDLGGTRIPVRVSTADGSIYQVPTLPNFSVVGASAAISDDGDTLAGFYRTTGGLFRGFLHDITDDTINVIEPVLPDSDDLFTFNARGISSDGLVVVAYENDREASGDGRRAVRYELGDGSLLIPLMPGGTWSAGVSTSMDGLMALVIGDSTEFPNGELYLHNDDDDALTPLGSPWAAAAPNNGWGMTGDMSVVVGSYFDANDDNETRSFVHNQHGWFSLERFVVSMGVSLDGWELYSAEGVSRDGRLVYGSGERNGVTEGFVVEFPDGYLANVNPENALPIYGIGNLPGGGQPGSEVRDATLVDGNIHATGYAQIGSVSGIPPRGANAYWTLTEGLQELPNAVSDTFSGHFVSGSSITPDAAFIVGRTRADTGNRRLAARWNTSDLSLELLPTPIDLASFGYSAATTISEDGNTVAGFYIDESGSFGGFLADINVGTVSSIVPGVPDVTNVFTAGARGLSADGSVVVGNYQVSVNGETTEYGYRFTNGGGVVTPPLLDGGTWSRAGGITPDGVTTVMAGSSTAYPNGELYLHDANTGEVTPLGSPDPDRQPALLVGLNGDASILSATYHVDNVNEGTAYLRNQQGWFGLEEAVISAGGSLGDWELTIVRGVSRDARLVFGAGVRNGLREGFVIEFPENYLADFVPVRLEGPLDPAIIGGWTVKEGDATVILIFTPDGHYAHMENVVGDEFPGDMTGYEIGRYEFGLDGSIQIRTMIDTNGGIGLSDDEGRDDITATVANGELTYNVPGEGSFTLTQLEDENNPIIGAWNLDSGGGDDSDGIVLVAFAADGSSYLLQHDEADNDGQPGIEFSSFAWDSTTGAFAASNFVIDQNGEWGLSHPEGPTTVEIQNFGHRLFYSDTEGGASFQRIALLPVDITAQPDGDELDAGEDLNLSIQVDGDGPFTYQWRINGVDIDGATSGSFMITGVSTDDAGIYDVVVTGPDGSVISAPATVTVEDEVPSDAFLANFSVRQVVETGGVFALPFRIEGEASKMVLLRAVGPTLGGFGLPNTMDDPRMRLVDDLGFEVAANDDWDDSDGSSVSSTSGTVGAFPLGAGNEDAAMVLLLPAGSYTLLIDSAGGGGIVLAEIYDADSTVGTRPVSRLVYLAALGDTSLGIFNPGFVLSGGDGELVVRALGSGTGLPNASGNPLLSVSNSSGQIVVQNDDWGTVGDLELDFEDVGASPLLQGSTDAAELFEPSPGAYTMQVNGSPGLMLAEVYDFYDRDLPTTPILLIPPRSMTVTSGDMARFESYVSGAGPVTLQWVKDSVPLIGETSPILEFISVAVSDAGQYVLRLTNAAGTFDAAPVTLMLESNAQPPSIDTQPVDTTIQSGETATLSVAAVSSAGGLGYQWYEGNSGDTSLPISGATDASYTTNALSTTTSYWVRATDNGGGVDSNTATVTVQATSTINATHALVEAGFRPGGTVTINTTLTYEGNAASSGWEVVLPLGWSYASSAGDDVPQSTPNSGDTGTLSWAYISTPASPAAFSYTLNVPNDAEGPIQISAQVLFRDGTNPEQTIVATPSPLTISSAPAFHTADTDGDSRFSLSELLRVIEIYNTRFGTTRTGHYQVQSGTEDGFAANPNLSNSESGGLAMFHAADSNSDGKLGLSELLRVIELYNYREGTVRTGAYRVENGTEDGFAPGPASAP